MLHLLAFLWYTTILAINEHDANTWHFFSTLMLNLFLFMLSHFLLSDYIIFFTMFTTNEWTSSFKKIVHCHQDGMTWWEEGFSSSSLKNLMC
jgi:hypothetical protein